MLWCPLTVVGPDLPWSRPQHLARDGGVGVGEGRAQCPDGAGQRLGGGAGLFFAGSDRERPAVITWRLGLLLQLPVDRSHLFCPKRQSAGALLAAGRRKR